MWFLLRKTGTKLPGDPGEMGAQPRDKNQAEKSADPDNSRGRSGRGQELPPPAGLLRGRRRPQIALSVREGGGPAIERGRPGGALREARFSGRRREGVGDSLDARGLCWGTPIPTRRDGCCIFHHPPLVNFAAARQPSRHRPRDPRPVPGAEAVWRRERKRRRPARKDGLCGHKRQIPAWREPLASTNRRFRVRRGDLRAQTADSGLEGGTCERKRRLPAPKERLRAKTRDSDREPRGREERLAGAEVSGGAVADDLVAKDGAGARENAGFWPGTSGRRGPKATRGCPR